MSNCCPPGSAGEMTEGKIEPSTQKIVRGGGRITVVEHAYHQKSGSKITHIEGGYTRFISSNEEAYSCRLLLKEVDGWQKVDIGWLEKISLLHISNDGKSPIEMSVNAAHAVDWLIPRGESFRGMPARPELIEIRCAKGETKATVTLFPG